MLPFDAKQPLRNPVRSPTAVSQNRTPTESPLTTSLSQPDHHRAWRLHGPVHTDLAAALTTPRQLLQCLSNFEGAHRSCCKFASRSRPCPRLHPTCEDKEFQGHR